MYMLICLFLSSHISLVFCQLYGLRECRHSQEGAEYMGQISTTRSGRTCQRWDSQSPHSHGFTDHRRYPDNDFQLTANNCRNPGLDSEGPWCYTTDPSVRFEYCDVPKCEIYPECKWTSSGTEYRGTLSQTVSGHTCIPWSDVGEDGDYNFCRNNIEDPEGPYCYYTPDEWEHCDVPFCKDSVPCKDSSAGTEYTGTRSITRTNIPCQRWDHNTPHDHDFTDPNSFPDGSLQDAANYCRNPDATHPDGPWCYTRDPETEWEYCDIPVCEANQHASHKQCELSSPVRHVLHIGLDGMHASCFLDASSGAPNIMERLAQKGSYTLDLGRTVLETMSGPGWSSHVCGMNVESTGITRNHWNAPWMGFFEDTSPVTSDRVPLPCAFMYFKGMDENVHTASFMNWRWIYNLGNRGAPGSVDVDFSCTNLGVDGGTCDHFVTGNASEYLQNIKHGATDRSYTFIHIDMLDQIGHEFSWCSENYLDGVNIVDQMVGDLLDAVDDDNGEEWLVFLSTDHGGSLWGHGSWIDADLMIPLFMRGPGVKQNYQFTSQVSNGDIVPTAACAMGIKPSPWWTGKPISEAFEI